MAHDFANAYDNVKIAVKGLIASDPLRASLNRVSAQFKKIDDDDFDRAPHLRAEFRALRNRLRRNSSNKVNPIRSLDNTDSDGMILLAENLLSFLERIELIEDINMITSAPTRDLHRTSIRDPGPSGWDEDRSLD